jgi:hypothetical protein
VRHTWRLLRMTPGHSTRDAALEAYVGVSARLLHALAGVTGARVIVDSSKRPPDGALLRLLPGIVPYYVHLVRDPRAVAYSWSRRKQQLDKGRPAEMKPHGPAASTLSWIGWNVAAEALRRRHPREKSLVLRYEDFVARPRPSLEAIAALVGERPEPLPIEGERDALLAPNHTVSGNPSRFSIGRIQLREDREWMTRQPVRDRLLVTGLAAPMLRRYGYELWPRARSVTCASS